MTCKYSKYNSYSGAVTIPCSVTCNGTTHSVTSIGGYAFNGCGGLTSVTIPAGDAIALHIKTFNGEQVWAFQK